MSGVFTFNSSPPKPESPFVGNTPAHPTPTATPHPGLPESMVDDLPGHLKMTVNSGRVRSGAVVRDSGTVGDDGEELQGLAAEPQMGPTEYKLSLVRGSKTEKPERRRQRLEQLTTQLLWRLQQSTSYHATSLQSTSAEAIPSLLQESKGALYMIGVADDGTLVGLDEQELEESLDVLRHLASKLGADITVTRKVYVRSVTQLDVDRAQKKLEDHIKTRLRSKRGKRVGVGPGKDEISAEEQARIDADKFQVPQLGAKLFVAEALVKPRDGSAITAEKEKDDGGKRTANPDPTEQLRISFTGPTNCGKSTLIGTLTTGEPDNGQGKNRLSVSRHRHELLSGVTSSVTWEIVGYKPEPQEEEYDTDEEFFGSGGSGVPANDGDVMSRVINYATGHISSWTDVHGVAAGGRVVFMSDSPGQTKYRRSLFRSLVGWSPHYAALVISANDLEEHQQFVGDNESRLSETSYTHLDLCLKLGLRMVVIFSKMDATSKTNFSKVFKKVTETLKERGRKPWGVTVPKTLQAAVEAVSRDPLVAVPLIFTSSVKEDKIDLLHGLLMGLPVPEPPIRPKVDDAVRPLPDTTLTGAVEGIRDLAIAAHGENVEIRSEDAMTHEEADAGDGELTTLFHVEEIYGLKPELSSSEPEAGEAGSVVSGHVRYGKISIGDRLLVGPFPVGEYGRPRSRSATPTPTATPASQSILSTPSTHTNSVFARSVDESGDEGRGRTPEPRRADPNDEKEWRTVKVVSVRRLRLPVITLYADEAGTIGIIPVEDEPEESQSPDQASIDTQVAASEAAHVERSPPVPTVKVDPIPIGETEPVSDKKMVTFASPPKPAHSALPELSLRKGVAIINRPSKNGDQTWPQGYSAFAAVLHDDEAAQSMTVGSNWTVYVGSVRAVVRIVFVDPPVPVWSASGSGNGRASQQRKDSSAGLFDFEEEPGDEEADAEPPSFLHTHDGPRRYGFEFLTGVEWMEMGAKVLVTRSGSEPGATKPDMFVGEVVQRIRNLI